MPRSDDRRSLRCSFCGKQQSQVNRLIAGNGSYICDDCVRMCMSILGNTEEKEIITGYDGMPLVFDRLPKREYKKAKAEVAYHGIKLSKKEFLYSYYLLAARIPGYLALRIA